MNITPENVTESWNKWTNLHYSERDSIIEAALFGGVGNGKYPHVFSSNAKISEDTDMLIAKLNDLEIPAIAAQESPRSSLSSVYFGGVPIPLMPYHKAIAFCAFMVAGSE